MLGNVTPKPLNDVSEPWQLAQVWLFGGASVKFAGGSGLNARNIAGTDISATIVVANIAVLRLFVPDRIAPLRNIKTPPSSFKAFLNFFRT